MKQIFCRTDNGSVLIAAVMIIFVLLFLAGTFFARLRKTEKIQNRNYIKEQEMFLESLKQKEEAGK